RSRRSPRIKSRGNRAARHGARLPDACSPAPAPAVFFLGVRGSQPPARAHSQPLSIDHQSRPENQESRSPSPLGRRCRAHVSRRAPSGAARDAEEGRPGRRALTTPAARRGGGAASFRPGHRDLFGIGDRRGGRALQRRRRHEELTVTGGGMVEAAGSRRGRFDGGHDGQCQGVPVVDQAECTAQTCRSCVALTLADVVALGCCPCAVVSLLGLAFVKAPLAVARRCLRRLRRRRGELRHKKRVRDDVDPAKPGRVLALAEATTTHDAGAASKCARASNSSSSSSSASGRLDAEKVWMEMYRVGHWGFGRLSISMAPPPPPPPAARPGCVAAGPGRSPDGGDGRRKDVDLRCEPRVPSHRIDGPPP
ncbi:hypothetical protein U9M48_018174, partial [Paspalum notatum var. saurae]